MTERFEILEQSIRSLLEHKAYPAIKALLATLNPSDIAGLMSRMEQRSLPYIFRLLGKEPAALAFSEMEPADQETLLCSFSDLELKELLEEMYVDDAADLVEEMPANVVKRILAQADPQMRRTINQILRYPEDSAGSVMTTEYVSLRPEFTVRDSIARIRRQGVDKETIYTCYVTVDRVLVGMVTVKDLLLAQDDEVLIKDIMITNIISVSTHDDRETVARQLSHYNFLALPVVDGENRMVGIVTFDDAMDVLQEAATEDMEIMSGMLPSEQT